MTDARADQNLERFDRLRDMREGRRSFATSCERFTGALGGRLTVEQAAARREAHSVGTLSDRTCEVVPATGGRSVGLVSDPASALRLARFGFTGAALLLILLVLVRQRGRR